MNPNCISRSLLLPNPALWEVSSTHLPKIHPLSGSSEAPKYFDKNPNPFHDKGKQEAICKAESVELEDARTEHTAQVD